MGDNDNNDNDNNNNNYRIERRRVVAKATRRLKTRKSLRKFIHCQNEL